MQYTHPYVVREDSMNIIGPIIGLVFLALMIAGIVLVVRVLMDHNRSPAGTSTGPEPLDIARERYAKGEITKEELGEMKTELAQK